MPSTHRWADIRGKGSPEEEEHIADERDRLIHVCAVTSWREHARIEPTALADRLGMTRAEISRIEEEADVDVVTLSAYVRALGGRLKLRAVFDDGKTVLPTELG